MQRNAIEQNYRYARAILYFVTVGMVLAACLYTFSPVLVPWHAQRMGLHVDHTLDVTNTETTCPDTMIVMWALYRVAGIEGLALSALMFIILNTGFKRKQAWSWWAILIITSCAHGVTIYVAWFVDYRITPWQAPLLALAVSDVALYLSRKSCVN